jgi:hypothetical protein
MNDNYNINELEKDMKLLKFQSRIQTIAVVLLFFFGVATIRDILKNKNGR